MNFNFKISSDVLLLKHIYASGIAAKVDKLAFQPSGEERRQHEKKCVENFVIPSWTSCYSQSVLEEEREERERNSPLQRF